jgi:signal transduction histidine kinase
MQQPTHELPNADNTRAATATAQDHGQLSAAQVAIVSEIVSGIAHDMGTPLNVISGYAESMMMVLTEDSPVRRHASTIVDQTRRVANMIRQVLDVVRPAPGNASASKALDRFASDVHEISSHMLRQHKVRSQFDAAGPQGVVTGDLPRLAQALYGILRSAAIVVGPKGQFGVRTVSDDALMTGIAIEGTVAGGAAANLSALAEPGLGLRESAHVGLALAELVLGEHSGRLEPLPARDGRAPSGLFIRIGALDTSAREVRTGGDVGA